MKALPVRHIATSQALESGIGRFHVRSLQQVLNRKDLHTELHKHDFFFVLAVQKGKGLHEIDFNSYPVKDGSIFLVRPGQAHKLQLEAKASGYLMEFDLSFIQQKNFISEQRWKKAFRKNYCETESGKFAKLYAQLDSIYDEYIEKKEGYPEAILAYLNLFFLEYIRESDDPARMASATVNYAQERFEELSQLLEQNITGMKRVSQYAELLNLSPYQLNAITKAAVGKTVSELINEQIILEAKRHLLATSHQIKEIADQLGYEDHSYFIRFFKQQTGLSPDAFRKNFR
jgi:AraC-like DNA-binding protein